MGRLLTRQEFEERVNKVHNDTIDLSGFKWINSTTKGLCRCKICGNEWEAIGYTLMAGHGCRKCYDKRNSEKHKIKQEEIQQRIYSLGINVEIIEDYKDTKHKCLCKCNECGYEWEVCVQQILSKKSGCPKCNALKVTPKEFEKDMIKKYGDEYNLTKLNYQGLSKKVTLIHPVYGVIKVKASKLYNNPKMDLVKIYVKKDSTDLRQNKINIDDVKLRINTIHNYKYDLSLFNEYKNRNEKINIICPEHGVFISTVCRLTNGQGCPLCGRIKQGLSRRIKQEEYIKQVEEIHKGENLDLSNVVYSGYSNYIDVICNEEEDGKKHGLFRIRASLFLKGHSCPKCGGCLRLTKEEFIEKAKKVHGAKYDYTKVCIICPEHGEFWQTPNAHLRGAGCPSCKESHFERNIKLLLTKNDVNYIQQQRFDWLNNGITGHKYPLDFYLPDYNIAIECQGEQHFIANFYKSKGVEFAEKHLKDVQYRDLHKKQLCKEHDVNLIYFLNKKFVKYLADGDVYFTNEDDLINFIKKS